MVLAGELDRLALVLEAELLEPFRGQVEVFESPPDLLAGQWPLAELLLRRADCFHAKHGIDQAADVEDLTGFVPFGGVALTLVIDILLQILVQLELTCSVLKG